MAKIYATDRGGREHVLEASPDTSVMEVLRDNDLIELAGTIIQFSLDH